MRTGLVFCEREEEEGTHARVRTTTARDAVELKSKASFLDQTELSSLDEPREDFEAVVFAIGELGVCVAGVRMDDVDAPDGCGRCHPCSRLNVTLVLRRWLGKLAVSNQ